MGTFYLHTQEISSVAFIVSLPVGCLITNILIVNNFRDVDEDRNSNKKTLAVILGKEFTRWQYILLIMISYFTSIVLYYRFNFNLWIFLPIATIPISLILIKMLFTLKDEELNRTLELSAKFAGLYGLLLSIGLIL
jgi:1,4-dihydroxy-2-naphthoate octaprenyltransferase